MAGPAAGLGVSKPRAAGVRRPYAAVPERVRAWVEETLGSPVALDRRAGRRDVAGLRDAAGLRGRDPGLREGGRPGAQRQTPELFRHEIAALGVLGEHPLWAPLLASYDEPGGWVALLLGDVEGRHPDMTDAGDVATVLAAVDRFVDALAGRGAGTRRRWARWTARSAATSRCGRTWAMCPTTSSRVGPGNGSRRCGPGYRN